MNLVVSLTEELQQFVERSVQSGRFLSGSELLVEALENLKAAEEFRGLQRIKLKQKVREGLDALSKGDVGFWDKDSIRRKGLELLAKERERA